MEKVRTRFAPSPTGFLHVGGVRTALFAWLLARRSGGSFALRIEDTDRERLVPEAVRAIIEDLDWLGVTIDEGPSLNDLQASGHAWPAANGIGGPYGPYVQSLRLEKYKAAAEELVAKGFAYRCDCTPERLEAERKEQERAGKAAFGYSGYCRDRNVSPESKHVIRFRVPDDTPITLNDLVRGPITWELPSLKDTVILKSDGFPTYHLAVVVDDHEMETTHVLRGEEWISTTPIHLLLYRAFGWQPPAFAHLPSVLGQDGKKLSKRHGATNVSAFREEGYLPEALFNFLVLIGWSPGDGEEQEIFAKEELIERFSLDRVNRAAGVFSFEKLNWMNGMYMRALPPSELARRLKPFLVQAGLKVDDRKLEEITPHIQERLALLKDAAPLVDFLFQDEINYDLKAMLHKGIDAPKATEILRRAQEVLGALTSFTPAEVEAAMRSLTAEFPYPAGAIFMTMRIGITGKKVTPPLFESTSILGREQTLKRLNRAELLLAEQ